MMVVRWSGKILWLRPSEWLNPSTGQKVFCMAQKADMVLPVLGDSKVEPVHRTVG